MGKAPFTFGYVTSDTLFMKKEPDKYADTVCILKKNDPIIIDTNGGTDDYYLATANGVSGYCLKEFIVIK